MMKTYHVKTSDGKGHDLRSHSAADAMQTALEKNIGKTVTRCWFGTASHNYGEFEIPKHDALTQAPEKREKKSHEVETDANRQAREKHAPWIEEWLASK